MDDVRSGGLLPAAEKRAGAVRRVANLGQVETKDSGQEAGAYTIKGHASVFNQPCDFGCFKEYVAPGAFIPALAVKPLEVVSNWQHDDRWILGHTLNKTLDLWEDTQGLMQWTRVAPTSWAADLRILLDRGDIQQASFCFVIEDETWDYVNEGEPNEEIKVTINKVRTLYDVTVCALGAYPQTDVSVAGRSRLDRALRSGRVPGLTLDGAQERGILPASTGGRRSSLARASSASTTRANARTANDDFLKAARIDLERARLAMPSTGTVRTSRQAQNNLDPKANLARARADLNRARAATRTGR
jgi:uncharacterized protein